MQDQSRRARPAGQQT